MTSLDLKVKQISLKAFQELYPELDIQSEQIVINETKPEFEGDYTLVLFPFLKSLKIKPDELGNKIGNFLLQNHSDIIHKYSIVAGFLNLTLSDECILIFLESSKAQINTENFKLDSTQKIMVEYSSPNTNKPLHFGHLRNNFLGWSVSEILKTTGNEVVKANLINDRGIHICKSMIAWMKYANGATPESTSIKGDHLVGDYYVKFNDVYKAEMDELINNGMDEKTAEKEAPIFKEAQELLRKWEAGDAEVYELWKKMNSWVYDGFEVTYNKLGIDFDKYYYESDTYLLGKDLVKDGLEKGILYKKENGSVWIDLTADGLDEKLLLRADGTSVYMTQDLGTAKKKYDDFQIDKSVYVIADEQNYHMQVLQLILQKLGEKCGDGIYHLSYGMVELPTGKMKSREGTVVDADDMIDEMISMAKEQSEAVGKNEGMPEEELKELYETIGLGALKFYLLRVDPKKKMVFNPQESIDLHGFTATYIQYTHARISSILRKTGKHYSLDTKSNLESLEKTLLLLLEQYPNEVKKAAIELNPSIICNYTFKLAQTFNSFFDKHSVANAESDEKKNLRIAICMLTANVIKNAMALLGIRVPEKM